MTRQDVVATSLFQTVNGCVRSLENTQPHSEEVPLGPCYPELSTCCLLDSWF